MPQMTISQVAREIHVRPSAIRYYERIGLLPPAERRSGQRRYDRTVLYRLAIIHRARELGFTLSEIRQLFFGFRDVTDRVGVCRYRSTTQRMWNLSTAFASAFKKLDPSLSSRRLRTPEPASKFQVSNLFATKHMNMDAVLTLLKQHIISASASIIWKKRLR